MVIKKISAAQLVILVYLLGIFLLRILTSLKFFSWRLVLDNFYFVLGGLFGWVLLKGDRIVDAFFVTPQTQLSHQIRHLTKKFQILKLWQLLEERKAEQKHLAFRSAIFQAAWALIALFAITSTASFFGKGVILGLGLHLLFDEWKDYRQKGSTFLRDWLFWQIKREVNLKETKIFLWTMTGIFVFLSLLMI